LGAVAFSLASQVILNGTLIFKPYIIVTFFSTFLIYNLHNIIVFFTKDRKVELNFIQNKNIIFILTAFAILAIGFIAPSLKINTFIFYAITLFLCLFYFFPILKINRQAFSIRQIPYLKIFFISIIWSFTTVIPTAFEFQIDITDSRIYIALISRFFFIFAITLPFDIRDHLQDKREGLVTLANTLSFKKLTSLSNITLLLSLIVSLISYSSFSNPYSMIPCIIATALPFYLINSYKFKISPFYYYGYLDGTIIFYGVVYAVIFIFSN